MTDTRPDILIRSPEGSPIAVVEVKNIQNLSLKEVIDLRHSIALSGVAAQAPYFLLLSQDVGYLWKKTKHESLNEPPTAQFPMDKVVTRYSSNHSNRRLYNEVLEILVLQWLTNLSENPQQTTEEPERTLALSGFNESIKGATVLIGEAG